MVWSAVFFRGDETEEALKPAQVVCHQEISKTSILINRVSKRCVVFLFKVHAFARYMETAARFENGAWSVCLQI